MQTITLNEAAMAACRAHALKGREWLDTATPNPDQPGHFDVPVDDEVKAELKRRAFTGETTSDTILRLFAGKPN